MPEERHPAVIVSHNRFLSKARWKGKKQTGEESEREAHAKASQDEQVLDFLRPSVKPAHIPPAQQLGRLDIASAKRWPGASEIRRSSTTPSGGRHFRATSRGSRSRSPRRNKKGYNVEFTEAWPEVIGEGGDEAELPTCQVTSGSTPSRPGIGVRNSSDGPRRPLQMDRSVGANIDRLQSSGPAGMIPHLARATPTVSTAMRSPMGIERLPMASADDGGSDGLVSPLTSSQEELADTLKDRPVSVFQATSQAMRVEEGNALCSGLHYDTTPPGSRDEFLIAAGSGAPDLDLPSWRHLPVKSYTASQTHSIMTNPSPGRDHLDPAKLPSNITSSPSPHYASRSTPSPLPAIQSYPFSVDDFHHQLDSTIPKRSGASLNHVPPLAAIVARPSPPPSRAGALPSADDSALKDFGARVKHMSILFQLSADSIRSRAQTPASDWVRAGVWWFLRGQTELEAAIRLQSANGGRQSTASRNPPNQAYLDLAKAYWISTQVVPTLPGLSNPPSTDVTQASQLAQTNIDATALVQMNHRVFRHLRALIAMMQRTGFMPPDADDPLLTQGLEPEIWLAYPTLASDVAGLLYGQSARLLVDSVSTALPVLSDLMPLHDTEKDFSYGRMFVQTMLQDEYCNSPEVRMDCILSMMRDRTDWQMSIAIASQSGLVNLRVQPDGRHGTTWEDVQWRQATSQLIVRLPRSIIVTVQLRAPDFQTLWSIFSYTQKVQASLGPDSGEKVVFEDTLLRFQFMSSDPRSSRFPKEPIERCRIRLFEKTPTLSDGVGSRHVHRGFRIMIITSPQTKALSSISHPLADGETIRFAVLGDNRDGAGLLLKVKEAQAQSTTIMTFQDIHRRNRLLALLRGNQLQDDERMLADIPCQAFSIEPTPAEIHLLRSDVLQDLAFSQLRAIDRSPEDRDGVGLRRMILSESLRLCLESKVATLTDRINLGPEQFFWRLDVRSPLDLRVLRDPQEDLTISVAEPQLAKDVLEALNSLLNIVRTCETVRLFRLHSLDDLHMLQTATTGFSVVFDGTSTSLTIARRRMVVSIGKKWEANLARIQIVRREAVVQMVVFFADFTHGQCMNFQLKGTDTYESYIKSNKHFVRLVDAKFALPKVRGADAADYLCLDLPNYPTEHDDITVAFDDEQESERFQAALPASVNKLSRMASLTR